MSQKSLHVGNKWLKRKSATSATDVASFEGAAIGMLTAGMSTRAVARELNVHFSTISHLQTFYIEFGSTSNRPHNRRPRVTTPAQDLHIQHLHLQDCLRPATRTAAATIGLHNQRISAQTVRNRLREAHLHACRPHRGLDLPTVHRRNRLEWPNADTELDTEYTFDLVRKVYTAAYKILHDTEHTLNFMASSSGPALNEELQCSICMEVFIDPVTTPCGHNFCRTCLTNNQTCFCPFCKERSRKILDLESNTAQRLTEVMQNFKEKLNIGESGVVCDFCDERKQKAVKSCLTCQSSYCDDHLEPHLRISRLKKHTLINAVENLEDYICQKHKRPLEMFCRDDQTCVCLSCSEGEHRTHNTVPTEEESPEKKLGQTDMQQMIQDKMKEIQESEHSVELRKASSSEVESAARAFIEVLARGLAASSSSGTSSTRENMRLSEASGITPLPILPEPENRVRQALKRQFPSMFRTENDQPRGKKRFSLAKPVNVKKTDFQIDVLSKQTLFTPKKDEDLELLHAGLGKRLLSFPDTFKHNEIVTLLEEEFPKLKTLQGGWMFYKSTGSSGQRKLTLIPTDSDGYSTRLLKSVSKNGKNMLYVVPLQEQLSIEPLPYDAVEFAKMPLSNCMKCSKKIPLPLLPLHIEECNTTETEYVNDVILPEEEDDEIVSEANDQPSPLYTDLEEPSQICPICQISFPADVLPYHASMCGEGERSFSGSDSPSTSTRQELPRPSTAQSYTSLSAGCAPHFLLAWKYETDPQKASRMFCAELLSQNSFSPSMSLMINQFDTVDKQDRTLISFYKKNNANWSAPLRCSLIGDAAVGKGVNRHIFSMIMQKLKTGFSLNLGSAATTLFEGEKNHRVPSASVVLRDSNLFQMAGRMIGHSFIHGGPCLSGLSLPVVILLTGGSANSAASALTLQDCPDLDHRETIRLLKKTKLTEEERTRLTELCLFWDLPVLSSTNREWLFQQLLSHAVIGRVKRQIKDLRKGIKETGIWPLLSQRPHIQNIVFPRDSVMNITSQTVLQKIEWPKDNYSIAVETKCVITSYMRRFIEEASPNMLSDLMKFWVGWEVPEENLVLEVVTARYPVAHTCFKSLSLPCHYQSYAAFKMDMVMCLQSVNSGFGLV